MASGAAHDPQRAALVFAPGDLDDTDVQGGPLLDQMAASVASFTAVGAYDQDGVSARVGIPQINRRKNDFRMISRPLMVGARVSVQRMAQREDGMKDRKAGVFSCACAPMLAGKIDLPTRTKR